MIFKSIVEVKSIKGKKILLRVDYNVPIKGGKIQDNARIMASLPTIRLLEQRGVKQIIIAAHLGRPTGKYDKKLTLKPVAAELARLLKREVVLVPLNDFQSKKITSQVVLLENLRFDKGEEANNPSLVKKLSQLAQIYINDAFSVSHRACASVVGVTRLLPSYGGLSLIQEVLSLSRVSQDIKKPLVIIIGGAKVEDKLPVIDELAKKADYILTGGMVATTFLAAAGYGVGKSLYDKKQLVRAKQIIKKAKAKLLLPSDVVVDIIGTRKKEVVVTTSSQIKNNYCALDLGPTTVRQYASIIKKAKTILWVGTLGKTEEAIYAHASKALGRLVSAKARRSAFVVIGGGDTDGFFHQHKFWVNHASLAGSATLEFLAGEQLPGLTALGFK